METKLGKIERVSFGHGGRDDVMFGISFTLSGVAWGVGDFWGVWSPALMPRSEHAQWTEADRDDEIVAVSKRIDQLLAAAKVKDVNRLVGIPVEATFDGTLLKSWRVLTEVL